MPKMQVGTTDGRQRRRTPALVLVLSVLLASVALVAGTAPTARGADQATCTEVIGFSQTAQWFEGGFESVVAGSKYQLRWASGGDILQWSQPGYAGWTGPMSSACVSGYTAPDRVIFQVTRAKYMDRADIFPAVGYMVDVIDNIHAYYPQAQVYLMNIVGGPGMGQLCEWTPTAQTISEGQTQPYVRATWNGPSLGAAMAYALQQRPEVGIAAVPEIGHPSLSDCAGYEDWGGHIADSAIPYNAQRIGNTILARFGGVPSPTPTPVPTTSPSVSPTTTATASPTPSATASPTPTATSTPSPSGSLLLNGTTAYARNATVTTTDWTIDLWFKDTNTTANHDRTYLLSLGLTDTNGEMPLVAFAEWNRICAGARHNWSTAYVCVNAPAVGQWHHLTATKTAGSVTVAVDGVSNSGSVATGNSNGQPLSIGANGGGAYTWRGNMADVLVNGTNRLTGAALLGGAVMVAEGHP
jgi:hypothetical protein